jgi:hypothetical protein
MQRSMVGQTLGLGLIATVCWYGLRPGSSGFWTGLPTLTVDGAFTGFMI